MNGIIAMQMQLTGTSMLQILVISILGFHRMNKKSTVIYTYVHSPFLNSTFEPVASNNLHPHSEQILQAQLSHIIADVLVKLQVPVRIRRLVIPKPLLRIRLPHHPGSAQQLLVPPSHRCTHHQDPLQAIMNPRAVDPPLRRRAPHSQRGKTMVLLRLLFGIAVASRDLVHGLPELRFAEHQNARTAAHAGLTVLRGLARNVGEVNALDVVRLVYTVLRQGAVVDEITFPKA